jgi:GT2 family glycosyltransferase
VSRTSETVPWSQVSLIVCTRNRAGFVEKLIESILSGQRVPDEIVVIDQSDHLKSESPRARGDGGDRGCVIVHVHSGSKGLSAARNEGLRTARHGIIVFVDDDMVATPTWLEALVSPLLDSEPRTVVTGQVRATAPEVPGGFALSLKTDEEGVVYEGRVPADVLYPNNMALPRAAFDEVGGFDERFGAGMRRFPGAEDNDFCFRLLEAGYRIVYEPRALLYHRAWRPPDQFLRLQWRYARGQGAFYGKHISLQDRYMLQRLGRDIVGRSSRVALVLVRRPGSAAANAVFVAGIMSAVVEWLLTERLLQRTPTDT